MKTKSSKKVVVIGAGLGGMSAAISLASAGFEVEIFEKNSHAGGKLNRFQKDGFSFDLGPSIFTLPHIFRQLFTTAGKEMKEYVQIVPVRPHWRNFFEDQTVLDLDPDPRIMAEQLAKLGPGLEQQFEKFLDYSKKQYHAVNSAYFRSGADTVWEMLASCPPWRVLRLDLMHTMAGAIEKRIREPHLRSIFEFFIKYVGSSATRAPGFMNLMPNIQFEFGLWYVQGGMFELARGLTRLSGDLGIPLHLNQEVVGISRQQDRVSGIELADGTQVPADIVVCNMEVIPAYQRLLHENEVFMHKLDKFEPACSGLVIHLAVDRVYPQLAHHNFFYSADQHDHFAAVFERKELPGDPTLYVVAASRTDGRVAPPNCDNIKILPHIPYIQEGHPYSDDDYRQLKDRVLEKLERMGLTDLRRHVLFEHVWTPRDIERNYYSNHGAIYGVATDYRKNLGFKAPKQSSRYRNLFFTGGSVNPGGGMPMAVLCGQKVCERILALH